MVCCCLLGPGQLPMAYMKDMRLMASTFRIINAGSAALRGQGTEQP